MLKKLAVPIVAGGMLLGGIASAGTAYAGTPTASVATAHVKNSAIRAWVKAHRREIAKAGATISAETIGVTPQDLVAELKSGKSIADVAGEHSVNVQSVVTALDNAADARINRAVIDHKLSSTEANKIEAALPTALAKAVSHTF